MDGPTPPLRVQIPASMGGWRLDRVLEALVEGESRARLQKLVRRGQVRVDGRRVHRSNARVRGREELQVQLGDAPGPPGPPGPQELPLIHEDEHLLVVEKPAGLATHPAERVRG